VEEFFRGSGVLPQNSSVDQLEQNEMVPQKQLVACMTSDFAMQNVLMQIGLNIIGVEGKLIRHVRNYVLWCYGCFKKTFKLDKKFCPSCGNQTLQRITASLGPSGTGGLPQLQLHFSKNYVRKNKKPSTLPTPKGGKHANNPIVCEDQPRPQQRPKQSKAAKMCSEDFDTYSPFPIHDVTSRAAKLGIRKRNR